MKLNKSFLKGSLLLGSIFILTACGNNNEEEATTVAETTVAETTAAETTTAEATTTKEATTAAETTAAETTTAEATTTKEATTAAETTAEATTKEATTQAETTAEATTKEATTQAETTAEATTKEATTQAETTAAETTTAEATTKEATTEAETTKEATTKEATTKEATTKEATTKEATTTAAVTPASTGEQAELKDGEYTAVSNKDEFGWAMKFTITVKDGKISASNYDYVNDDGKLKTEDEEYNKNMKDATGVSDSEAIDQLNKALVDSQNPTDVSVVSGASTTSSQFIFASKVLLKAAQEGNTGEINIDELPLKDGEYTTKGALDEHGWIPTMSIVVKDGKITEAVFDYVNEDGAKKSEDEEYNKQMKDATGVSDIEAMAQLGDQLVKTQNLAEVDVVSGATTTSEEFITLASQLIQAAKLGEQPMAEETVESTASSEEETTKAVTTAAETTKEETTKAEATTVEETTAE